MDQTNLGIGARVEHPKYGEGIVVGGDLSFTKVFFRNVGDKEIAKSFEGLKVLEPAGSIDNSLSLDDVKFALTQVLQKFADFTLLVPLGERWKGGQMILQPADKSLKPKEIPIETFFHKIVMLRDRLRVLEQQINGNAKLSDEDKVNLQQYITRCYGSLTTFNVFFQRKEDQFVGEGGKD
ncbi:MAG: hypothetical protein SFW35_01980 [Chitinophagales bacterium]|nr:hypothetical protein [Chitinophagales bacterium]